MAMMDIENRMLIDSEWEDLEGESEEERDWEDEIECAIGDDRYNDRWCERD